MPAVPNQNCQPQRQVAFRRARTKSQSEFRIKCMNRSVTPALNGHRFRWKWRTKKNHGSSGDISFPHRSRSVRSIEPGTQVPRSRCSDQTLSLIGLSWKLEIHHNDCWKMHKNLPQLERCSLPWRPNLRRCAYLCCPPRWDWTRVWMCLSKVWVYPENTGRSHHSVPPQIYSKSVEMVNNSTDLSKLKLPQTVG